MGRIESIAAKVKAAAVKWNEGAKADYLNFIGAPTEPIVVKTYMSHGDMQRSARKMHARGYRIAAQSGQFNQWRLFSGKHTVT